MIVLHIFQELFEIRIPTGITFHACFCDIFQQKSGLILTHMKNAVTTIIGLFFVLRCKKHGINKFTHIWTDTRGPSSVISAIFRIHFFVVLMLWSHVLRLGDVFGKVLVGPSMGTNQLVIPVADSYLCHCSLKNCRLIIIRVQY